MSPYPPKSADGRLRTIAIFVVALAALASLLVAASGGEARTVKATAANPHLLLGITGNPARFKTQTGQDSAVQQVFLGWGQGVTYGSPLAQFLPTLAPIPMLHLSTKNGQTGAEAITPGEIASGAGDSYLVGLNKAIAVWGKAIYVRPMAEMNNAGSVYAAYNANGTPRDANHSTASFRKAFARIYVILHGGTANAINAKLKLLGMPPLKVAGDLLDNPFPTLRVVWSPLAADSPRIAGNAAEQYYPGKAYVDVEGGDIYDEALTDTAPWAGLERLYKTAVGRGKPFSVPEWGLKAVDDPAFVRHMCTFLQTHGATETSIFYEFPTGSDYDLDSKPASRAAYRQCLTPLAGDYPSWALGNEPGGGAKLIALSLTPKPASGTPPQAVVFAVHAKLTQPIAHWEIVFGDGSTTEGDGPPPSTIPHSYKRAGIYHAVLFVFRAPPFTIEDTPFFTAADVIVGTGPNQLLSVVPTPDSGPLPLSVSFRVDEVPSGATGWKMIFGDGLTRDETGPPPHFIGHTFAVAGTYPVLMIVDTSGGSQYAAVAQVVAGGGGGGGGGGGTTTTTPNGPPAPPATGTSKGVVLVNGKPFTGGHVPYNANVDVTGGSLQLKTDTGQIKLYGAGGVVSKFKLQRGTDRGKPIVVLALTGGDFSSCPARKTSSAAATAPTKPVRLLWGSGKGKFQTKGRYAAATVRGTIWETIDRCDGTLIIVKKGVIQVLDLKLKKLITVTAGHRYLAKA